MFPPPMMSVPPATTPPPRYACARASDVDLRRERVVFDEPPAELHDLAHEPREQLLGLGGVLDRDLLERARLGIHGALAELLGVHLAEALEAVEPDARLPANDLEHRIAKRLERRRVLGALREGHGERRHAGSLDQRGVDAQEVAVLRRLEQLAPDAMRRREAGLRLHRAHAQRGLVL